MAISIDDIDEFGVSTPEPDTNQDNSQGNSEEPIIQEPSDDGDIISELLNDRGINDLNKIKFQNEDGTVIERSWDSLSREEQREILNQDPQKDPDIELNSDEINLINHLRVNGITSQQFVEQLQNESVQQYLKNDNSNYSTDELTDDELFILDLQYRSPDMTEEEINNALAVAKSNEDLFNKQISGIRNYYKSLEKDMQSQKELEAEEQANQQFQQYSNSILNSISNIKSIGNLDIELSNDDSDEIAQFILGRDQAGINWFGKALEDPDTVVRMAWFALKGEETFNDIENYISQQIKTTAQKFYEKGLQEGRKTKSNSTTVIVDHKKQSPSNILNVNDLDF